MLAIMIRKRTYFHFVCDRLWLFISNNTCSTKNLIYRQMIINCSIQEGKYRFISYIGRFIPWNTKKWLLTTFSRFLFFTSSAIKHAISFCIFQLRHLLRISWRVWHNVCVNSISWSKLLRSSLSPHNGVCFFAWNCSITTAVDKWLRFCSLCDFPWQFNSAWIDYWFTTCEEFSSMYTTWALKFSWSQSFCSMCLLPS